jgi:hypothetical protein
MTAEATVLRRILQELPLALDLVTPLEVAQNLAKQV